MAKIKKPVTQIHHFVKQAVEDFVLFTKIKSKQTKYILKNVRAGIKRNTIATVSLSLLVKGSAFHKPRNTDCLVVCYKENRGCNYMPRTRLVLWAMHRERAHFRYAVTARVDNSISKAKNIA